MPTTSREEKWTYERRKRVYERMLKEFGPKSIWKGARYPLDRKPDFDRVLKELATRFSKETGMSFTALAVRQQFDFGITVQKELKDKSQVKSLILNVAAALDARFIKRADLPSYLRLGRKEA